LSPVDVEFLKQWLDRLLALNGTLHPVAQEPFYLTGLNLACWFDMYFDNTHTQPFFRDIHAVMHRSVDLTMLAGDYRPQTGIRDKIDKIAAFSEMIGCGDAAFLGGLIRSIRDDYPLTGTWFAAEARQFAEAIERAGNQ